MSHSDDARIAIGWMDEGDEPFEKGDFEGSIECYHKALTLFPRDPDLWNVKGLALSEMKRYEEAIGLQLVLFWRERRYATQHLRCST
jgi:tetratricopeptide (TPR) repeat protein